MSVSWQFSSEVTSRGNQSDFTRVENCHLATGRISLILISFQSIIPWYSSCCCATDFLSFYRSFPRKSTNNYSRCFKEFSRKTNKDHSKSYYAVFELFSRRFSLRIHILFLPESRENFRQGYSKKSTKNSSRMPSIN